MGAAPSLEQVYESRAQRKARKLAKLPPEVAEIKMRRIQNQSLAEKFNRDSGMHKMQESIGETTNNPLDWALGIGKKPTKPLPEEDDTPDSFFMRQKQGKKIDWDDPAKKKLRRTENVEDQAKHIIRVTCSLSTGYEMVEVVKHPYAIKSHTMTVDELEMSDLLNVHFVFKEKMEPWMFYCKSVQDWPMQPDHIDPASFDTIILQFKATKTDFRDGGSSIEAKIVDRYRFLKLLLELDLTGVTDKRIDLGWDPNGNDPITVQEEPLLRQFEAKQVLNYYKELDASPEKKDQKVDATKIGRISMKDAFRIIMTSLIAEASEYAPLEAPASTHSCNNATAMETMQKRRRRAAERLEAKAVGKLGRMRGPKKDMRQVVQKVAYTFHHRFKPVFDDIAYFEFSSVRGERLMRRNSAWEFVAMMDSIDLIRPMKLVLEIPTLNQDTTGWTSVSSDPAARAEQMGANAGFEDEEEQHYILARWMRRKVLHAARVHEMKQAYSPATALEIATNKKKGRAAIKDAKARSSVAEPYHRKVEAIVYPALMERQRREKEEGTSDLMRAHGKAWQLLDALDGLED